MQQDLRLRRIRRSMHKEGIDWLLVVRPSDVSYVTGFLGQDSWAVVTRRGVFLLTDSRYIEQAQKESPRVSIVERMGTLANTVIHLVQRDQPGLVGVDRSIMLSNWLNIHKKVGRRLRPIDEPLAAIRSVKAPSEVQYIQRAGLIARTALKRALTQIRPGMTELALAGLLELEIRRAGGSVAFETIVAFGPNGSRPHHQPSPRRLKENDSILVDFGARFMGYRSDITRTFVIGRPEHQFLKVFEVVRQAQEATIAAIRPGVTLSQIDAIPRQVIKEGGLPVYGHGSGHGIGLDIHEHPFLKPDAQGRLCIGQVLTIEPAVYLPGRLGVRLEDDVLVTKDGCQVLTRKGPHHYDLRSY